MKTSMETWWGRVIAHLVVTACVVLATWAIASSNTSAVQAEKVSALESRVSLVEKNAQETRDAVIAIQKDVEYIRMAIDGNAPWRSRSGP